MNPWIPGIYLAVACFVFGVALESKQDFVIAFMAACFWPVTICVGMGMLSARTPK